MCHLKWIREFNKICGPSILQKCSSNFLAGFYSDSRFWYYSFRILWLCGVSKGKVLWHYRHALMPVMNSEKQIFLIRRNICFIVLEKLSFPCTVDLSMTGRSPLKLCHDNWLDFDQVHWVPVTLALSIVIASSFPSGATSCTSCPSGPASLCTPRGESRRWSRVICIVLVLSLLSHERYMSYIFGSFCYRRSTS